MHGELHSSESLGTDIQILARGLPARIGANSYSAEIRGVSKYERTCLTAVVSRSVVQLVPRASHGFRQLSELASYVSRLTASANAMQPASGKPQP